MQMPEKDMAAFEKVVLAGMKLMYDPKTFEIFKRGMLRKDLPMPARLAQEAAGLMKMLDDKAGGKIPRQVIAPAGAMLLMEMGKFMAEAGIDAPTSKDVQQGIALLMKALEQMFAGGPRTPAPAQQQQAPAPAGLMGA